jgi:hypothetical protein
MAAAQSATAAEAFIAQPSAHSALAAPEALLSRYAAFHPGVATPLAPITNLPQPTSIDPRMNASYISQSGTNNFAAVAQSGGGNLSVVVQHGTGNQAIVSQTHR